MKAKINPKSFSTVLDVFETLIEKGLMERVYTTDGKTFFKTSHKIDRKLVKVFYVFTKKFHNLSC